MSNCFSIVSYNSQGSGPGRFNYINSLLSLYDVILIQEHWLMESQFDLFNRYIDNANVHCVSGMPSNVINYGRPYGGCAVLWKKTINANVTPICTDNTRLCVIKLTLNKASFLICNIYMPTDMGNSVSYLNEYSDIINVLSAIIKSEDCNYVVVGGDLNTSFERGGKNVDCLTKFMKNESLSCCLNYKEADIKYTYCSKINGSKSLIDHFMVSENLYQAMTSYTSPCQVDNLSDHNPVVLELTIPVSYMSSDYKLSMDSVNWGKASINDINNYKTTLNELLGNISIPESAIYCNSLHCKIHVKEIEIFHNAIVDACINAGCVTIPSKKGHSKDKHKVIPGWNEYVKQHRHEALTWHNLWKERGSPRSGYVADMRNKTRAQYHYSLRFVHKNNKHIIANRMASNLMSNNNCNFWKDVKKVKGSKSMLPCTVDDISGNTNISNMFANKYKELYNSVSYDVEDMSNLVDKVDRDILHNCCSGKCYSSEYC